MDIKQIGNYWIAYLPGRVRVPGQFRLRSQAVTNYQIYFNEFKLGNVDPYTQTDVEPTLENVESPKAIVAPLVDSKDIFRVAPKKTTEIKVTKKATMKNSNKGKRKP